MKNSLKTANLPISKSFQTKVTLTFIFSLLFLALVGNLLFYEYSLNSQFNQMREKLLVIARNAALAVNTDSLLQIPLNRQGVNSPAYKIIIDNLNQIKQINPTLKYIYLMAKTNKEGTWQFIADPNPVAEATNFRRPTAFPGDGYDVSRFPEMSKAFEGAIADRKLTIDEWGTTLSGYAPIYNQAGKAIAVLGVDIDASRVYAMEKALQIRAAAVLLFAILLSILLGLLVSRRVTKPIEKLVEGTKKIASGDLGYKVEVKGEDEIGELARSFNNMADSLSESRKKLEDYFYRVVEAMVRSLEAKHPYTRGHSERVAEYAEKIASVMGFPSGKIQLLKRAAQLHDIGKLGIHEDVLDKNSALSDSEWDKMRRHPAVGEEILKPIFLDNEMLAVVRSHHERYDGTGYPDGLKGDAISIFAQIVSVCDAYDAMTSSRAYRAALSKEEAIDRLKKSSGTQLNPRIVEALVKVLEQER